jgi:DNA-binding response OmpR family regulator
MRTDSNMTRNISVLIVEDESMIAAHQVALMVEAGYNVVASAREAEGALIAAADSPPEVAIIDVSLDGEIDGITVGRELRRRHGTAIVFVTGHLEQAVRQMPDLDAIFIGKPFHDDEVLKAVREALHGRGASARME